MARVLIPLADGFEDIEAVTVIDVLRRGGVEVVTASITDRCEVLSAHGIQMKADALFSDVSEESYEAILLPGGGEGTENLRNSAAVIARLKAQKEEGGLLCAICAAPTVLTDAGVVDEGLHVTCYPTCVMGLDRRSANVPVVADEDVITGQAPGSAMLFALVVLQALTSPAVAHKVAMGLVTDVFD
jgi:protein deglycase